LSYGKAGRVPLKLDLYLPKGDASEPRPTVVLIHGGAWLFGTRFQLHWYGRRLAQEGYVAASINYRMLPAYPFPYCLHDCKAAVRWLRLNASEYGIDPDRIGAIGNSAGGHLASLLATTRPRDGFEGPLNPEASSEVQAAISLYGAVDLTDYRRWGDRSLHGMAANNFIGYFVSLSRGKRPGSSAWETASPITYAHREAPPMMFIHGTRDILVDVEQSSRFAQRLHEVGAHAELLTLHNRGHGFDFFDPWKRREVWSDMLEFLNQRLRGNGETPDTPQARTVNEE
jgi:acetyl esterase/lipase